MHLIRTPKILIIERQMIIAADVSLQLLKLGYHVIGIHTRLEDALLTLEDNRPDIVLMSIEQYRKTKGINEIGIISKSFQIPVVFLSAHTDVEIIQQAIKIQPFAFIIKPYKIRDLQRGLQISLNRIESQSK